MDKEKKKDRQLDKIVDGFIEDFGQLGASLGLNRAAVQIYALLSMSDVPLSLDDMVERIKISKGNVSVNVRELEKWEAARKVWVKGERKDFYVAELDIFRVITNRLRIGLGRRMDEALAAIKQAEEAIQSQRESFDEQDKLRAKVLHERLEKAKETYWRMNSFASTAFKIIG